MTIESIPTFGAESENNSGNTSEAGSTTNTLELTDDELATYTQYEAYVDMGRYVAKLRKHDDGDDLAKLMAWIGEQKEDFMQKCKKLEGNLPMVRLTFPVEDRLGDDYYVLPKAEAAKVGINYDEEDYVLLPISDGNKWTPSVSLGRPTYVDDEFGEAENEEQFGESESDFDMSNLTVDDIRTTITNVEDVETLEAMLDDEKSGKARKTAVAAIEARIRTVSEAEEKSEEEASDESENASNDDEDDEVAAAKVEALNAATAAITELTEAIKNI